LLDRPLEDDSLNYLERDSQENISDMVKFLVDKKYKSIGLVGLESELWIFEKIYKGYIKAMEEVKCPLGIFKFKKNELSYFNEPDHNDFLDFCKRHSAIIIGDPHAGLIDYIVAFLTQNKISIPEKCAVLSLTNKNELISYGIPVSSFSITPQEMGTKAGEGIIRILESEDTVPLNIKFKTEIKWKY
jgi:DNA-binding LacI/PurR family transcriptional regulator